MGAGLEAGVPTVLRIELSQQQEELVGGGVQPCGQIGNGLAELFGQRRGDERAAIGLCV